MYSYNLRQLAKREIEDRNTLAQSDLDDRRLKAYEKCPELQTIQDEIASCSARLARLIGFDGNVEEQVKQLKAESLALQARRASLLEENGFPEDWLKLHFTCPVCSDSGFSDGKVCECQKALLRSLMFEELNKKAPLSRSTFESFRMDYYSDVKDPKLGVSPRRQMEKVFKVCRDYASGFNLHSQSLFMYGATGLGKTHLSLAIAGTVVNSGFGVVYYSAPNMLSELEAQHFGRSQNDESTESELLTCDLLIIDDLGAEFSTQFTVSCIYNIINTRMLEKRPVIISTNLTPRELEDKYTQRITSRIIGGFVPLLFCGRDIRQMI